MIKLVILSLLLSVASCASFPSERAGLLREVTKQEARVKAAKTEIATGNAIVISGQIALREANAAYEAARTALDENLGEIE